MCFNQLKSSNIQVTRTHNFFFIISPQISSYTFKMQIILFLFVCYAPFGYGESEEYMFPLRKVSVLCNLNEELCDTECYNPSTQKCLANKDGFVHRVCELDQTLCGNQCWTESGDEVCTPQGSGFPTICQSGELSCGGVCYKPAESECFEGMSLCPKGKLACGSECYSPSDPVKCSQTQYRTSLCKSDEEVCGSWGCYNPQEKTCFEKLDRLCKKGAEPCGNSCYNPASGDTCHNGTFGGVVCSAGETHCNNVCFDPKDGLICPNGAILCKAGETNCGVRECYEPSSGSQCFEARPDYHVVCEKGEGYCHYNCYKPATEACLTIEGQDFKKVCPTGHQICNGQLAHNHWGYGCFDPATSECLKNSQNVNVLCQKGESVCGTTCYTPTNDGLVCRENGEMCKPDQEICGQKCYDSTTKKCFKDIVSDIQWG